MPVQPFKNTPTKQWKVHRVTHFWEAFLRHANVDVDLGPCSFRRIKHRFAVQPMAAKRQRGGFYFLLCTEPERQQEKKQPNAGIPVGQVHVAGGEDVLVLPAFASAV
ncbi:hypothetical protein ZHAS_00020535 [Anopheles sinensis]|uniref:Uncharacterized protein n=1 Tax=Anopheles sinensis TaxID=74873 RepID=A0A084WQ09_ANOSI|nr:hypothetical protein ZHAS_00020535 [Anopheles sinensis]